MSRLKAKNLAIVLSVVATLGPIKAYATNYAYDFGGDPTGSMVLSDTDDFFYGFNFTVANPQIVRALGSWVNTAVSYSIPVRLWQLGAGQTLLLSRNIESGSTPACSFEQSSVAPPGFGFCTRATDSITLMPGITYQLTGLYAQSDAGSYITGILQTLVNFNSNISYLGNVLSNSSYQLPATGTFSLPAGQLGQLGPNLILENPPSSSVPAPLPLFGATIGFAYSRKIRRRIATSTAS